MLVPSARTKPPDRQWSVFYVRRTTIVWSSEAACACRPATLHYWKSSSTLFVRLPQARRLRSIHGPTIAPMLPPDGWRLEAELYSPASNKTSSPPQARRVLWLSDSPLTLPVTDKSGATQPTRSIFGPTHVG